MDSENAIAMQIAESLADYSPDGGLPEHWHHIDRRGMGGRARLEDLRTMGVSASLHQRIHTEGNSVLESMPVRPSFADMW